MARNRHSREDEEKREVKDVGGKNCDKPRRRKPYQGKEKDNERERSKFRYDYNDPTYYIKDPEILAQATQLSFQNIMGIQPINNYEVPTIMTVFMNPSVGLTYQGSNPAYLSHPSRAGINMASIKLFNMLSMKSGRNMAYAPQDIGTMLAGMSQILAIISFMRRALGTAKISSYRNRMFPKAMVEAMGFDYDDLVANWSDYRTAFNNEIAVLNQIPIVVNSGYLKKSINQYDFIFTDSESSMAQMYIYVPYSTWIIDETSYSGGTVLKTLPVVGNGTNRVHMVRTFAWYMINVLRPMVDAMLTSSTLNLVYADILNLATSNAKIELYQVPIVPEDFIVMPMHNYEALLHIHNMTAVGVPTYPTRDTLSNGWEITPNNDVYPDPSNNALVYNPAWHRSGVSANGDPYDIVIDSPNMEPSLDEKLEMTRYKSYLTGNIFTQPGGTSEYGTYGLTTDYYVCFFGIISNTITINSSGQITTEVIFANVGPSSGFTADLTARISQFDWAPMLIHTVPDSGDARIGHIDKITGDLNYFTSVDKSYIERLMSVVFFGLFDI